MKRTLAILLALIMLFGVIPLTAFAEEMDAAPEAAEEELAQTGAALTISKQPPQEATIYRLQQPTFDSGYSYPTIVFGVTGGTGNYTYKWLYGDHEGAFNALAAETESPVYQPTKEGYYACWVYDGSGSYAITDVTHVTNTDEGIMPKARVSGTKVQWFMPLCGETYNSRDEHSINIIRRDTAHDYVTYPWKLHIFGLSGKGEFARIYRDIAGNEANSYVYQQMPHTYDPATHIHSVDIQYALEDDKNYSDIEYYFSVYHLSGSKSVGWNSKRFKANELYSGSEAFPTTGIYSHYGEIQIMDGTYTVGSTLKLNVNGGRWKDNLDKCDVYIQRETNGDFINVQKVSNLSYVVTSDDVGKRLRFKLVPKSGIERVGGEYFWEDEFFYSNIVTAAISGRIECVFAKPQAGYALENDITVFDSNDGKYCSLAKNTSSGTGLDWMCDDGSSKYVCNGCTCQGGNQYIAHVFFSAKSGYSFSGHSLKVYLNGQEATVTTAGDSTLHAYLEYDVPKVTEIDKVRVNITAPQAGAAPSFSASPYNATGWKVNSSLSDNFYTNGVLWHNVTDNTYMTSASRFEKGKRYRVMVSLVTSSERYLFADTDQITGVINQDYATVGCYAEATKRHNIYVEFTFDLDDVIHSVSVTVPEPVIGQAPVYSVDYPSGSKYSIDANMSLAWYEDGFTMKKTDLFRTGWEYSVKFTVKAKDNFKFESEPDVMVNGRPAVVEDYNETYAWVEYTFSEGNTVSGSYTSYLDESDQITIFLMQGGHTKYLATPAGNSGTYSIPNVPNGDYYLTVAKHNHVTRQYQITVSGDLTQDVKICPIGDADLNGKLASKDAMLAYQHALKKEGAELTGYAFDCADADRNGKVVSKDAMLIYQQVMGKHTLF